MLEKKYYSQNISARVRKISGMRVLFGEDKCFELNEIAYDVWITLEDEKTIEEVVDAIEQNYGAKRDTIKNDVTPFIQQLVEEGMLIASTSVHS